MPNNRPRHLASGHIIVDRLQHPAYLLCMDTKTTHLDARGLLCPLPVLKARKRLQSITVGDTLTMIADDPAAVIDVPHYCAESGNELVSSDQNGDDQIYVIRKTN